MKELSNQSIFYIVQIEYMIFDIFIYRGQTSFTSI